MNKPLNKVVIGLGSNIDPKSHIEQAIVHLARIGHIIKTSSLIETAPIGITNQPPFLNGAVLINTSLEQSLLNKALKEIEDTMGRDRTLPKFGPRIIDLDIVVWNDKVVDDDYYTRDFIRTSVNEVIK